MNEGKVTCKNSGSFEQKEKNGLKFDIRRLCSQPFNYGAGQDAKLGNRSLEGHKRKIALLGCCISSIRPLLGGEKGG